MTAAFSHETVLLNEAVQALHINPQGCYVDGTFGRGGHSKKILQQLDEKGCLYAIDKDQRAIEEAGKLADEDVRFDFYQGSFAEMDVLLGERYQGEIHGVLLDLGVSSPQLDNAERGFSFINDGPLDMRMDTSKGMTAAQWLARAQMGEIAEVLKVYGEERFARRIATAIVSARTEAPLSTTRELSELVATAIPRHEKHKHPATRSFQAIRIFINHELDDLEKGLQAALDLMAAGGRLVVISFHSLEDRIVKRFMRKHAQGDRLPPGVPVQFEQSNARLRLMGKPMFPSSEEIERNPRARSAVMRVAEVL